jgi:hypothetical protein
VLRFTSDPCLSLPLQYTLLSWDGKEKKQIPRIRLYPSCVVPWAPQVID